MRRVIRAFSAIERGVFASLALVAIALTGCTGGSGPAESFQQIGEAAASGDLTSAYDQALPASYKTEVDALITKATGLINEQEHAKITQLAKRAGGMLATMLAPMATEKPELKPRLDDLSDLPKLLGIDTYAAFTSLKARALIDSLATRVVKKALAAQGEDAPSAPKVELVKTEGDSATIKVSEAGAAAGSPAQEIALTKVEGKWLPAEMVAQWKPTLAEIDQQLAAFAEAKKQDPEIVMRTLEEIEGSLDEALGSLILGASQLGNFGFGN